MNNTRATVSHGCCSFIFKRLRYAVVLRPSSPPGSEGCSWLLTACIRCAKLTFLMANSSTSCHVFTLKRGSWFSFHVAFRSKNLWEVVEKPQLHGGVGHSPSPRRLFVCKLYSGSLEITVCMRSKQWQGGSLFLWRWSKPLFYSDRDNGPCWYLNIPTNFKSMEPQSQTSSICRSFACGLVSLWSL